ncbi:Mrp/NBP35 family ATP-binding protein [Candidatus Sumerlaeota bacterium]|nr:Mrp/NBP35 family ATP-binding protein [Candidatus Sumerlaeota bacterium]
MSPDPSGLRAQILERLATVNDPEIHRSLVELGMVKRAEVNDAREASIEIQLTTPACPLKGKIREDIEAALADLDLAAVEIEFSADVTRRRAPDADRQEIPGVRNVLAVGAGKGGVGKSTIACNLAIALAQEGARVGLLDTDIYGPNLPLMLGITERPIVRDEKIIPIEAHGIRMMSIGLLISEEEPVIWRGPMLHTAVRQFLFDVAWGELDYLVVDMPPGTGDVSLSMSQTVPVTGAVVVCTPSAVAVQDVRKAVRMFAQLQIPVLGLVENMRGFVCPHCGEATDIFSSGEAEAMARQMHIPYLGHVPLSPEVRAAGDTGRPLQVVAKDGPIASIFSGIARNLAGQVAVANFQSHRDSLVQIDVPE